MKKIGIIILSILGIFLIIFLINKDDNKINIKGVIKENQNNLLVIQQDNKTYNIINSDEDYEIGSEIELVCYNKEKIDFNECEVINYLPINDEEPEVIENKEIFADYYEQAKALMNSMSIEEKISQMLIVRRPQSNDVTMQQTNQFGGIIFFASDFKAKTKDEVIKMISDLQNVSKLPILTAIDEEGGTVSRISSNKNLVNSPFKSSQELYAEGGFPLISEDVKNKSMILQELGLNLNLAPVVDVSTNTSDYMYKRSLGLDTDATSIYAKTVIEASKGLGVSYTLKHFPGYGNNLDTHVGSSVDSRSYEDIWQYDLPPFQEGIKAGAEAVMVSHNIVKAIEDIPASLSLNIHNLLKEDLEFSGVIITDDVSMGALKNLEDVYIKAIKAGNDLIITSDYKEAIANIQKGLSEQAISIEDIDTHVLKILAWKYYKKLL